MILVVTHGRDLAADLVIRALHRRAAKVIRLDTDRLGSPGHGCAVLPRIGPVLVLDGHVVPADGIGAVWVRRFARPMVAAAAGPEFTGFVTREIFAVLDAVIETIPRQINPAEADRLAGNRLIQSAAARREGLEIPETLVTQDAALARNFRAQHPDVVTKAITFGQVVGDTTDDQGRFAFTSPLPPETPLDGLATCPSLFQARIPRVADWRVTTIGDRIFSARLVADADGPADWRQRPDAWEAFEAAELPAGIAAALLALSRNGGLVYAAHDLIERPDGGFVFLETNPAGQWGWLELHAGLAIGDAIADELLRPT
ncbi:MvdC/MvdD family ATP grasp protein [uncultured Tistrella sp.]|uniref:MvdC/MvdD family ATP grasp protein n=1 Tax=Tistrella mobilis TaxID=171437 RepID=UPI0026292B44|nr:hypothetical protein [uncultured Tistrella sp.]